MDLTFTAEQEAVAELAATILGDTCSSEQLREAERDGGPRWSRDAWQKLADADLLGIGLPEEVGGGGYGFCEVALVIEAVARAAAPVPAYATLVLGACADRPLRVRRAAARWLPGVIAGSAVLTRPARRRTGPLRQWTSRH